MLASEGRALYGRVDWNNAHQLPSSTSCRRALYGRVDWNWSGYQVRKKHRSRALYGRVDWNGRQVNCLLTRQLSRSLRARGLKQAKWERERLICQVALFTGAWIETESLSIGLLLYYVALFTGAWIETVAYAMSYSLCRVALFTGAWIETACLTFTNCNN